jgi:DnaJ-class molecular chaperone
MKLADVQENEPPPEQKCIDCRGEGVITVFSATTGLSLCAAICPTCGGSRYAP